MPQRYRHQARFPCRLKLALLLQDLDFGGTQRYALHLLNNIDRTCFDVKLWILRGGIDMLPAVAKPGLDCVWLSQATWVGPRALSNLMVRLFKDRPHILYTLTVVPNIWGRLFGKVAGTPVIVSSWRDLYPKQYESWMWPLSRRIIANSFLLKDLMVPRYGVDPSRVAVVPNGVDAQRFCPDGNLKALEPTILYVGRLEKEKDPANLLEAFWLTLRHFPETRLDIQGNGRLRDELQNWVRRRHLESKVRLLPGTIDILPILRRAWVLAMPSVREASPNVILEAMACELPVAGTRVGGIPELVRDGETGFIVDPGNPQALAEALCRLLGSESLRKAMGQRARQAVLAHHTIARMVRDTEYLLFEAAAKRNLDFSTGHDTGSAMRLNQG